MENTPPRIERFAEAGILHPSALEIASKGVLQYIPPLGSVLLQSSTAARFLYVNKTKGGLVKSVTVPDFFLVQVLMFGTKFFWYRFQNFFWRQIFLCPVPVSPKRTENSQEFQGPGCHIVKLWSGWYIGTHTAGAPLLEFYLVFRVLFQFNLI